VLALVLTTGCAGISGKKKTPPAKTLSHGRFVYLANRACARANGRAKRIKNPTSFETFVAGLRKAIPVFESEIVDFRALAPPPSDAASFRRLLATLDAEDLAGHGLLDAVEARQVRRGKTLARRVDVLSKRFNKRATKLGLRICTRS